MQSLKSLPPNTHADLELSDKLAFSLQRISREDLGIELVVSSFPLLHFFLMMIIASFRFEDKDENEDQVQLLLIVRMLKSVTVMA